jgi:hypothetical protein
MFSDAGTVRSLERVLGGANPAGRWRLFHCRSTRTARASHGTRSAVSPEASACRSPSPAPSTTAGLNQPGARAYYERKLAEAKSNKEALRCLKRRISDVVYRQLLADAERQAKAGPGGQTGTTLQSSVTGPTPTPALRTSHNPDPPPRLRQPPFAPRVDRGGANRRSPGRHGRTTR